MLVFEPPAPVRCQGSSWTQQTPIPSSAQALAQEESSTHHLVPGWVLLLSPPPHSLFPCGGMSPHVPQAPQCSTHCSSAADCDSYCKPAKGNYKINMKKYCKKDYGKDLQPLWATLGFAPEADEGWLWVGQMKASRG